MEKLTCVLLWPRVVCINLQSIMQCVLMYTCVHGCCCGADTDTNTSALSAPICSMYWQCLRTSGFPLVVPYSAMCCRHMYLESKLPQLQPQGMFGPGGALGGMMGGAGFGRLALPPCLTDRAKEVSLSVILVLFHAICTTLWMLGYW